MLLYRFCKPSDDSRRQKQVAQILDKLITLTIDERRMYPSVQAKIWGSIGQVPELLDMVLDCFIQRSVNAGADMIDTMADTAVALASANVQLVSKKVIGRMCKVIDQTCHSPAVVLEQHVMWPDIATLARYLLMLSFNNCLDVGRHLPYLFHVVTFLACTGTPTMRAATHGLVINITHSLCTCSQPTFNEEAQRVLMLSLDEFALSKFYQMFGISDVKSAAVTAFRTSKPVVEEERLCESDEDSCCLPPPHSQHPRPSAPSPVPSIVSDRDRMPLQALETISDALLEIMEACSGDVPHCDWLHTRTSLAKSFAFCYNPALQPRALIVYGCISKSVTDGEMKELLRILVKALEAYDDLSLIEAILICLTRLQPLLNPESPIHNALFWVALAALQLDDQQLYAAGLALMEQNLHTLDSQGQFDEKSLEQVLMETREPLEWHFKQLDHAVGLSFRSNFHFAIVGHLIKGYRHPSPATVSRTCRVLSALLTITGGSDKFIVTPHTVAYLTALVSVSEEVRSRCHVKHYIPQWPPKYFFFVPDHLQSQPSRMIHPSSSQSSGSRRQKSWDVLDQAALSSAHGGKSPTIPSSSRSHSPHFASVSHQDSEGRAHSMQHGPTGDAARSDLTDDNNSGLDVPDDDGRGSPSTDEMMERPSSTKSGDSDFRDSPALKVCSPTLNTGGRRGPIQLERTCKSCIQKYETEIRILYRYLAEGSEVFPKVFPVIHSLLDMKINHVLMHCYDEDILSAVQTIIQNMVASEDASQQQLHYMQSCGFGGLWRFAGPFTKNQGTAGSSELFVSFLEAMVDTILPGDSPGRPPPPDPDRPDIPVPVRPTHLYASPDVPKPAPKPYSVPRDEYSLPLDDTAANF